MKRKLALFALVAATVGVPAFAPAASAAPIAAVRTCGAGYVHANLPWGEKCLRAGEFCVRGSRAYLRYGFACPSTGHLRRR
jgi:hypothetical protein